MKGVQEVTIQQLYDLKHTAAGAYLEKLTYPWEALAHISDWILEIGASLDKADYREASEHVWIHRTAGISESASITGPAIIGADTEVRPCAFIRGNALVGEGCVVGNSTELKNVILFDHVQVPHYNYVGDSILGYRSHMGAGSITSNVKSDKTPVHVKGTDSVTGELFDFDTGRRKFGAMLGDFVEIGCNSVLNPGTVIGSHTNVYPLSPVRGFIPADSIYKTGGVLVAKRKPVTP